MTNKRISTWAEWPPSLDNGTMEDVFMQNAAAYASQRQLELAKRLGFGIHDIIDVSPSNIAFLG